MSDPNDLKVTDNRMFNELGELREQFRHLESEEAPTEVEEEVEATAEPPQPVVEPTEPEVEPAAAVGRVDSAQHDGAERSPLPETGYEASEMGVQFMDLVAVVAEPIALFLGDAALPDGRTAEDLERARLYIDLLGVLRDKTQGNLEPQEAAVVDDLIYRLRLRYVEKSS